MSVFDFLLLLSGACGLLMVLGSLYLLRVGALTLSKASDESALDVSIADKVKISTSYPALGLFVIGILFVGMALYVAYPKDLEVYRVSGELASQQARGFDGVKLELCAGPWLVPASSDGMIDYDLAPTYNRLKLQVEAPGFEQGSQLTSVRIDGTRILVGHIDLGAQLVSTADLSPSSSNVPEYDPEDRQALGGTVPYYGY